MARIALLYSGLPRQWSPCLASQLALFRDHATDVFFHFWDTVDEDEKRELVSAYQPKSYVFEAPMDFTPLERQVTRLDNINSPARMASMYYSWQRVLQVFDEYRHQAGISYDYAVRLRTDLMFFGCLDSFLPKLGPHDLLVSNYNDFHRINDMFALGGVEPVRFYLRLYEFLSSYQEEVLFNPEHLLWHHLQRNPQGMRVLSTRLVILVFRPHMVGMPIDACLKEHPGANKWKDPEIVAAHQAFHTERIGESGERYVEQFIHALWKNPPNPKSS